MTRILGMCFNWRVAVALGVLAVGVWFVAPQLALAVLPLLLLALCPLSMLWMMRSTGHQGAGSTAQVADAATRLAEFEREHARVSGEIQRLRAQVAPDGPTKRAEAEPE